MSLSDGTEIPMAYTLLPDNIANRLQKNIFEDSSFLLRLQYDIDGWTLFKESPLAGHGLGATEGLLTLYSRSFMSPFISTTTCYR